MQDSFSKVSCQGNFSNLPIELLLPISDFLDWNEFNALVRSNREFYQHLNGKLYKRQSRTAAFKCINWAIKHDLLSTVKHVIEAGYDINERAKIGILEKCTPIALACFHNKIEIFEWLLNHGADPNGFCWGEQQTLLTLCLRLGHEEIAKLLLNDDRINIHVEDGYGQTPLMVAVQCLPEMVGRLIDKDAEPYVKSNVYRDNTRDYWDRKTPVNPWTFMRIGGGPSPEYTVKIYGLEKARFTQQPENKTPLQQAAHHGFGPKLSDHLGVMFDKSLELALAGKATATPMEQYCNSFYGAARFGRVHTLQTWIEHFGDQIDPNQVEGEMCNTPFGAAVREREMGTLQVLWNWSKVDPTIPSPQTSFTLLYQAADRGYEEIVKLLIDSGKFDLDYTDSSGEAPLVVAAANGHEGIVKLLLDSGKFNLDYTDSSGKTPIFVATANSHEAIVKLLIDSGKFNLDYTDSSGEVPLVVAAANGHEGIVKLLIDSGKLDVNYTDRSGKTPLAVAVTNDHKGIIKLLLDTGKFDMNHTDSSGETPMVVAAANGREGVVRLLIDSGKFDVDYTDSSRESQKPMIVAAANGHKEVVRILIDSGMFDVNETDSSGETPLEVAAAKGHERVVNLLLQAGADPNQCSDSRGTTVMWEVAASGSLRTMKLLLNTPGIQADLKCFGKTPLENARANRSEEDEVVQELKKFLERKSKDGR